MLITVNDQTSYAITSREVTDEGFLRVPGYVAKTGIQNYLASELGLDGGPLRIVPVYRPASEVFNTDSLSSYDGVDITLEHPDQFVNSDNYNKVSKGVVRGSGIADGDHVRCELIVKDKDTIQRINDGKCELSAGYTALYEHAPGEAPCGSPYEFIQRNITINHVAVVDRARAGHTARIFDNEGVEMKKLKIGDSEIEVPAVVAQHIAQLTADKDTAEADRDTAQADLKLEKDEREKLEKEKDEREKESTVKDAQVVVGDKAATFDGVTALDVKREALAKICISVADRSPSYVEARFDGELARKHVADAQHQSLADDFTADTGDTAESIVEKARAKYIDNLEKGVK